MIGRPYSWRVHSMRLPIAVAQPLIAGLPSTNSKPGGVCGKRVGIVPHDDRLRATVCVLVRAPFKVGVPTNTALNLR